MIWCVVMMQLPRSRCPRFRSLAPHSITKATKDFQVVFFVNFLALWCVLVVHHPTGVKENGQHHFEFALPGFFWSQGCWMFTLDDCALVSGSYPWTHDSSPVVTLFTNSGSLFAESSMSCATSRRSFFCSIFSSFGTNFEDTLRKANRRSKWNVPYQCLPPPPPQVLGRWHDGSAWPKSALSQWNRHFGLLRAFQNEHRSPPTLGHIWIGCTTP